MLMEDKRAVMEEQSDVEILEMKDPSEKSPDGNMTKNNRGHWSSQLDYIMTVIGSIVGYGNLWRFPYLCYRNGGGAFLIPYIFFLVTCGLPLFFLEVSIGQFAGKSNVHIWEVCPILKGVGIGQFIACWIGIIYYQNIIAWSLYYLGMSCSNVLPWSTCSNEWNTKQCMDASVVNKNRSHLDYALENGTAFAYKMVSDERNTSLPEFTFAHTDVEEFWQYKALGVSEGVHQIGGVQWHLAVSLLASWVMIFLCLIKGVKSVGKVVYLTALLPYLLLIILLVRTSIMPGSIDGITVFFKPNFTKLLELQVWLEALIMVFYSLSPGWGNVVTLSSYNKFNDNSLRNSIIVTSIGEATSLLSGTVIFTVLGFMANIHGVGISKVADSGPGLAFVAYPEGLSELPLPQLWAFLFFFMMLTVGLDSQFTWAETLITVIQDQFPHALRKRRLFLTAIVCIACFLLGLPFTTEGGIYYFQLVDWYIASVCLILYGILECLAFSWIYGIKNLSKDVELMLGRKIPFIFNLLLRYITPAFLSVALFLVLSQFQPPTYGEYVYPTRYRIAGWMLACVPILPIPIVAVIVLLKTKGTLLHRLKTASKASKSWRPALMKYQELYKR